MFDTYNNRIYYHATNERMIKKIMDVFERAEMEQLEARISKLPIDRVIKAMMEVDDEIPLFTRPDENMTANLCKVRMDARLSTLKFKLALIEKEIWEKNNGRL